MNIDRLVTMACDITRFFDAEPDDGAAAGAIAHHLRRFWDPRMRRALIAHSQASPVDLPPRLHSALQIVRTVTERQICG